MAPEIQDLKKIKAKTQAFPQSEAASESTDQVPPARVPLVGF